MRRVAGRARAAPGEIGVERLAIHLGETLGRAEHRNRLDRLVGGDHHHRRRAGLDRGIGDVDRAEHVGLDALAPILFQQRHVLQRRGVEHDVGLEFLQEPPDPLAVAHIGKPAFDFGDRLLGRQRLLHRVKRGLRVLDDQQPRGAEGDDAVADVGADRAAAAGHHDRLALQERFEPAVVDRHARPQQKILDRHRRKPHRRAGLVERRHLARRQAEPPRPHQDRTRRRCRAQRPTA